MPGHKGRRFLGMEASDVTEIVGADVLYSPSGIILESENNATRLFGTAHTYYSTEGSSLSIKAMLALAKSTSESSVVFACRNVHKSFVYACGLLDLTVQWIEGESAHLCSATLTGETLKRTLENAKIKPMAVFVTSPDYLGNSLDIRELAKVCDEAGVPLLVDNAHGAYFRFLPADQHPISLGACMCADSAHKTLPVLTGGGYLHIAKKGKKEWLDGARETLSLFASTSPSYLILQSLDLCNSYLEKLRPRLKKEIKRIEGVKGKIEKIGIPLKNCEPLKIVLDCLPYGYEGRFIADYLRENGIEVEFFDREYIVCMCSPQNSSRDYRKLLSALRKLSPKTPIKKEEFSLGGTEQEVSIREALFGVKERVRVEQSVGRICASVCVSCPPAVPIAVSGERITKEMLPVFKAYGIEEIDVVK